LYYFCIAINELITDNLGFFYDNIKFLLASEILRWGTTLVFSFRYPIPFLNLLYSFKFQTKDVIEKRFTQSKFQNSYLKIFKKT
jgi:hypothetical protein